MVGTSYWNFGNLVFTKNNTMKNTIPYNRQNFGNLEHYTMKIAAL